MQTSTFLRSLIVLGILNGLVLVPAATADGGVVAQRRVPAPEARVQLGQRLLSIRSSPAITYSVFLPFIAGVRGCLAIPGESYGTIAVNNYVPPPANPSAEIHPDKNLALRGYMETSAYLGLVDYGGGSDPELPPQLPGLFGDNRVPTFTHAFRVYDWDWEHDCRGDPLYDWDVTLIGMQTTKDEIIRLPGSAYDIGRLPGGYSGMVLYASPTQLTVKYTREDDVVMGYTLHLEDVCVEPSLLAQYQAMVDAGRVRLPALNAGQAIGRAIDTEIGVAIRDTGAFMDPRSRGDWWRGR